MVLFNRFPYTGGHMLIAPSGHIADMELLDEPTLLEMMTLARDVQKVLTQTIHPQGFNIGINVHRCAGAGLPGHLHLHVVPRWEGDTNFMPVVGHVHIISQALEDLYQQMQTVSKQLGLPQIPGK
jgi:ATP adenylyltransferase